ncbi:TPA: SMC family ATPase, partial [Candidatus Woesearchaeota archaeon]|nr:SMC family ATPase [Candidatus Woesearchaeota archaeon]
MQLKRLVLRNIRSYTDAAIDFPQGSVLLAGDIGSGKSTILLAVEFALFGIKASELPGSSLLRHGKREGSVELVFSIDGRDILIKRVLKQAANGIVQDAGYLIRDGVKKDATPKELRALVFEILGYPKDLVGKSKDLIYRYTVYTPQEEMKKIIYE